MNKLIFRKLSFDIFSFFLLSSIAITSIVWVIQGVNLLDIVSEQGHGLNVYFFYTILNIPKIFSKLLIFTYFLTLFVVLIRYVESNEILVFWTNGIRKITFINFIGKLSIFFVILQLFLTLIIVPYTQNLKQEYLKNSTIEFFPKLIKEKKFSNITKNLTIFVEKNVKDGFFEGIYIKEKINDVESKIIIASKGKLFKNKNDQGFNFKLIDGNITNIDTNESINLKFKESVYELSKINSKTRKVSKLNETNSSYLIKCLDKFIQNRKDEEIRCGLESSFLIKDIYEEVFKRIVNPIYLIILSLISSLLILKPKLSLFDKYFRFFLFATGFLIILFSELSYKFISYTFLFEAIFITLPLIFIPIFYIILLFKTNFKMKYL
tara:strand:- start:6977 stop:8113 length:1137 start_codon:yes stop_codon:yes gene_type:complete